MQVSSLLSKYLDLSPSSKRPEVDEASNKATSAEATGTTSSGAAALREILSRYDVTDISPRKFSEMLQSLRTAGAITEEQFQDLSAIRTELDLQGFDPDENLDLVRFYTEKLEDACQADGEVPVGAAAVERRLEWLQKFAMMQSVPETAGVDWMA